jgi:curli biogenesis system outer membrane secretion channel CsgG
MIGTARTFGWLATLLMMALMGAGVAAAQDKPRVAVIAFDNTTIWWGPQLGASAADQLTNKLVNSGAFTMLERDRIDAIAAEQALGQSGAITPSQITKVGHLLGVEYLVTGRLTTFDIQQQSGRVRIPGTSQAVGGARARARSAMAVRVFSVATGEIVAASEGKGDESLGGAVSVPGVDLASVSQASPWNPTLADKALGPAVDQIVKDLIAKKNLMKTTAATASAQLVARVPAIVGFASDGSVYIDIGQNGGMTVGRRFTVMRVVDVIKDANGNILDRIMKQAGTIEVSQVLSQSSICKVIDGKPEKADLLEPAK